MQVKITALVAVLALVGLTTAPSERASAASDGYAATDVSAQKKQKSSGPAIPRASPRWAEQPTRHRRRHPASPPAENSASQLARQAVKRRAGNVCAVP